MLSSIFTTKCVRAFISTVSIFVLSGSVLKAQKLYKEGFLLTNSGDTIYGFIQTRSGKVSSDICNFKVAKQSPIQVFKPGEILGFRFNNSKFYISKEITTDSVKQLLFLEYLIKGKADVYYLHDLYGDRYFLQKEGDALSEISEKPKIITDANGIYRAPVRYKGKIKSILKDRPDLFQHIERTTLTHNSLIDLAKIYHKKVCTTEDCIVYKRKKPFQVQYGIVAGYALGNYNFGSQAITDFGSATQFGLTINIKDFVVSNEHFELNFTFLLEKDFRFTLRNHKKNNNENEYIRYKGKDFVLNSSPGVFNTAKIDVDLNTLSIKFPLTVNYNINLKNFTLSTGLGISNKVLLNQNDDFKYNDFHDQYGKSINSYFLGGISTFTLDYHTQSSKYYTLSLVAERLTAPRAVNQILRITSTQFSVRLGYTF